MGDVSLSYLCLLYTSYHTVSGQPLYYQIPKDKDGIWILMVFDCVIQGNQGLDYLNPDATDAYIGYTYETMYKRFPQYFGTVITKSFYDEPTLGYFREAGTYGHRTWTPGDVYKRQAYQLRQLC